jgi:diguanylate cyclase (GGDEF)-like protein
VRIGDPRGDGDADSHAGLPELRDRTALRRREIAREGADAAGARDAVAQDRDLAAGARDHAAALRDSAAAAHDDANRDHGHAMTGGELLLRARGYRRAADAERVRAAEERGRAAADRERAGTDRALAARDRQLARAERTALLAQLALAETDDLTGARTRRAGLADLDAEIALARKTSDRLAVAYVDIIGVKELNAAHGHNAGDTLLAVAANAVRRQLRSDDVMVRLGGDELLCIMPGATLDAIRRRFREIRKALAADRQPCEMKAGFAMLGPNDTATVLIDRADIKTRGRRPLHAVDDMPCR